MALKVLDDVISLFGGTADITSFLTTTDNSTIEAVDLVAQTLTIGAGIAAQVSQRAAVAAIVVDGAALETAKLVLQDDLQKPRTPTLTIIKDVDTVLGDVVAGFSSIGDVIAPHNPLSPIADVLADLCVAFGIGLDIGSVSSTTAVADAIAKLEPLLAKAILNQIPLPTVPAAFITSEKVLLSLMETVAAANTTSNSTTVANAANSVLAALNSVETSFKQLISSTGLTPGTVTESAATTNDATATLNGSSVPTTTTTNQLGTNGSDSGTVTATSGTDTYKDTVSPSDVTTSTLTATAGNNVASEVQTFASTDAITDDTLSFAGMAFNLAPNFGNVSVQQDGSLIALIASSTTGMSESIIEHPDGSVTFEDAFGTTFANYPSGALAGDSIKVIGSAIETVNSSGQGQNLTFEDTTTSTVGLIDLGPISSTEFDLNGSQSYGAVTFSVTGTTGSSTVVLSAVTGNTTPPSLSVDDPGTIVVTAGSGNDTLKISGNLSSVLTSGVDIHFIGGSGTEVVDASAMTSATTVEVQAGTGAISVLMGPSETLLLDNPASFIGTISDFAVGNTIDLAGIGTATSATLGTNNVLTVQESSGSSFTLDLSPTASYGNDNFFVSSDGHGGTDIIVNEPPVTTVPGPETVTAGVVTPLTGISVADADAISADKTMTIVLSDGSGLLNATQENGATVSGADTTTMTLTGGLTAINAELATVTYTGSTSATTDTINLATSDGHGGSNDHTIAVAINEPPPLSYTYTLLNDPLATQDGTSLNQINDSGTILGGIGIDFIYNDGVYQSMPEPPSSYTGPNPVDWEVYNARINNAGQVVGDYVSQDDNGVAHEGGYIYNDSDGQYTAAINYPGASYTDANLINNSGQVAGNALNGSGNRVSYVYSNGTYTTISDPDAAPGASKGTEDLGFNDSGEVAGIYIDSNGDDHTHECRFFS